MRQRQGGVVRTCGATQQWIRWWCRVPINPAAEGDPKAAWVFLSTNCFRVLESKDVTLF